MLGSICGEQFVNGTSVIAPMQVCCWIRARVRSHVVAMYTRVSMDERGYDSKQSNNFRRVIDIGRLSLAFASVYRQLSDLSRR